MCRRVVLPALSRPRKSSLACLFNSPREARTSQTIELIAASAHVIVDRRRTKKTGSVMFLQKAGRWQLTPVDDEHARLSYKTAGSIEGTEDSIGLKKCMRQSRVSMSLLLSFVVYAHRIQKLSCNFRRRSYLTLPPAGSRHAKSARLATAICTSTYEV